MIHLLLSGGMLLVIAQLVCQVVQAVLVVQETSVREVLVVQEILDQVEDLEILILARAVIKGPLELFFHQVLFNHLVLFNSQVLISQLK
tara:strand:+ start:77 stop:343 length:267 start_codon:yes stop_codon:yes gene_type:complete